MAVQGAVLKKQHDDLKAELEQRDEANKNRLVTVAVPCVFIPEPDWPAGS